MPTDKQRKLYEQFRLQWMIDHGYTLTDLVIGLDETLQDDNGYGFLLDTFDFWESERGFHGEIWPCFDEWFCNEYEEDVRDC